MPADATALLSPERKAAPYLFHGQTSSLCETCLEIVPAKVIIEDERIYYLKRCRAHGVQKTLISDDLAYWKSQKEWLKPGDRPLRTQTRTDIGCPFDCGLCPDHEQHSCLAIVEVNSACNLACPVCFADAEDMHGGHLPLATIERMLDVLVESEGEPDLVQLSGGEPTLHPQFFEILDAVKRRPIRHVMINTNGVRIAQEAAFVERLASYAPRLEVYLQFDSLDDDALVDLRGARLSRIRRAALEALERVGLSTTLVAVVKRGVNDGEIAAIIDHALDWSCVRGVTFQPVQDAGRNEGFDAKANRMLLTQIRREVVKAGVFAAEDMIPLPCNPDQICIGYGLRNGRAVTPIT
ncbi:MAG TPA: radical SAM protein, partial [Sphingomonas sp.]